MQKSLKAVAIAFVLILSSFVIEEGEKMTIYLIGDSTVCTQPVSQAPVTGWGTPFAVFFDSTVVVENHARGGRSTRTFISENRWRPIADALKTGDYVFMQFGHNDEAKEEQYKARYTSPDDYRKNLIRFIRETRAKNAHPVLVTPVSRRKFNEEGVAQETHIEYSKVVGEVAAECQVPMVDLDTRSRELYQSFGVEGSKSLFNMSEPGQNPQFPLGVNDGTHFSEYGARLLAELVLDEMKRLKLSLLKKVAFSLAMSVPVSKGQNARNIPKDTSYNVGRVYTQIKKEFPYAIPVKDELPSGVTEQRNIVYTTLGLTPFGNRSLHLDIFKPVRKGKFPALLMIHGGGWRSGDKSMQVPMAQLLAAKGFVTIPVEYQLSLEAKYPAAVHNIKAAIRWVRANASRYDIDPDRISISGCSAGGQLASLVGMTNDIEIFEGTMGNNQVSSAVNAIIDIDGAINFMAPSSLNLSRKEDSPDVAWLGGSFLEKPAIWKEASAGYWATEKTVPVLFLNSGHSRFHAGQDELVGQLNEWGIYHEVHRFNVKLHPFWLFHPWADESVQYMADFLVKVSKKIY